MTKREARTTIATLLTRWVVELDRLALCARACDVEGEPPHVLWVDGNAYDAEALRGRDYVALDAGFIALVADREEAAAALDTMGWTRLAEVVKTRDDRTCVVVAPAFAAAVDRDRLRGEGRPN